MSENQPNFPALFRGATWQEEGNYCFVNAPKTPGLVDYLNTLERFGVQMQVVGDREIVAQFPKHIFQQLGMTELRQFIDQQLGKGSSAGRA